MDGLVLRRVRRAISRQRARRRPVSPMGAQRVGAIREISTLALLSLSPLIGYALGRIAKEELAPGKKWFILAKRASFISIAAVFLYQHKWQLWPTVIGLTIVFAYLSFKQFRMWWWVQSLLGIAYALLSMTPYAFLTSALIFIYGLPTGAVLARKKALKETFFAGAVLFAAALATAYFL